MSDRFGLPARGWGKSMLATTRTENFDDMAIAIRFDELQKACRDVVAIIRGLGVQYNLAALAGLTRVFQDRVGDRPVAVMWTGEPLDTLCWSVCDQRSGKADGPSRS